MRIDPTSFCIQLKPVIDDDCAWTGELEVNIITDKENPLDKGSYMSMMHLSEIVACSVAYMEENPKMIHAIEEFLNDVEEDMEDKKLTVTGVKDNVISIDFATKTKGNA